MRPIKSFTEAKRRLEELSDSIAELKQFMDMADSTISAVNMLKGDQGIVPVPHLNNGVSVPSNWSERVLELFKLAKGEPLMQRDAVELYLRTNWPKPDDRKELYQAISGAFNYLTNKKNLLVKTDRGYQLRS